MKYCLGELFETKFVTIINFKIQSLFLDIISCYTEETAPGFPQMQHFLPDVAKFDQYAVSYCQKNLCSYVLLRHLTRNF